MEVKIDWIKTVTECIIGIVYFLSKIFLPVYFVLSFFEDIIIWFFAKRITGIGYVFHYTVCQGPDMVTNAKYLYLSYYGDHKKVADIFTKDFKELVSSSLGKWPSLYINTNNFVYRNVLLTLQDAGMLELETLAGCKAPQIIEKIQIMDWSSVARCLWDKKALQRLFRIETINKYRLKRVDSYV